MGFDRTAQNAPTPEEYVVQTLAKRGHTITFAESCTAGLAAARLVDVPQASAVFNAAVVTYSNEAKTEYLQVSPETISARGVVSEAVALEMAAGAALRNKAEVAVGISGIAGPGGGTEEKPVGMVCFGFVIGDRQFAATKQFGDIGRAQVRKAAVDFVFNTLADNL